MVRRTLGLVLVAVGAFALCGVAANYGQAHVARSEARAAWAALEARGAIATMVASLDAASASPVEPALGAPVARLVIPRIGLDEIVVEGVGDRELNAGPGHLPGSALPGTRGNAIVSAHRDRHFSDLGDLSIGDTITTVTQHITTTWVVNGRRVVGRRAPVLRSTPEPTLTLTTCWPLRYFGTAPDRLIVTAVPAAVGTIAVGKIPGSS